MYHNNGRYTRPPLRNTISKGTKNKDFISQKGAVTNFAFGLNEKNEMNK